MLTNVTSKIFSRIINVSYFEILYSHGKKFQFGGTTKIGFRDGFFTINTLLNIQNNHNLLTFVAFFNLVKVFDTTDHELLIKIMERYGVPPEFCPAIHIMYQYLIVILKIGKSI